MGIYVINPPIIALNAATPVTITDSSASWTGSTVFSITSLTGVAITETSLVSATQVTLTISCGITLGFVTISDSSDSDSGQIQVGAVGQFGNEANLAERWGWDSVQQWSQLIGSQPWADAVRIQTALTYADSWIVTSLNRFGNYATPLVPIGSDIPIVQNWESEIGGEWLYLSRGLRDTNPQGKNAIVEVAKQTRDQIRLFAGPGGFLLAQRRWPATDAACGIGGRL